MGIYSGVDWPRWEAETYPELEDLAIMVPIFAALFPTIRFFLDQFVFEIVGRQLFDRKSGASEKKLIDAEKLELEKKLVKFKESGWKGIYYFSAEIFALLITYKEPWFWDTKYFWMGPGDQVWPEQKVKFKLKVLYSFAAGFYTYSIFALIFWETRRKDFGVSMSHHIASLFLIVCSYKIRFARIGSVVLAVHDASDIFMEIAKMNKYAGTPIIPDVFFVLFALSWFLLRLIYYPFWIIWSTSYESIQILKLKEHKAHGPIFYYIFNMLLIGLLVLHIYWWILIYRMLAKQIEARGKVGDDVRSDSEDEDE
ncbi:hypothetical protein O6H91_04G146500 [Diphasiastrum complanatum]|uniref:Uncharacterized protein n=1 Tax=Diphasiastrum complanatum TaxID=34168 RepID=A0ACC2E307_DIPCM|nr:hypothetical protein O6H91_04G146500 [Diphasiastrum complanatum]